MTLPSPPLSADRARDAQIAEAKSGWKCERCLNAGTITHAADAGVYDVFNQLVAAHSEASEGTCTDVAKVRAWLIPAVLTKARND